MNAVATNPASAAPTDPDLLRHLRHLAAYPELAQRGVFDELRAREYARLDKQDHVYLDYTGGHLYAESQPRKHLQQLTERVLGNPHSTNPASVVSTELTESARRSVLDFFHAGNDYHCIFTANASAALQIVGECYPFSSESTLLLLSDNHNSVNGIREYCKKKWGHYAYSMVDQRNELRIHEAALNAELAGHRDRKHRLFAYPAQSNVSGVKHNLGWILKAQAHGWDVLLDAAAFVPSSPLDLARFPANFVSVSFYKIFGYPTGLVCLLVHKDAFHKLVRPAFAGGTISLVSVGAKNHFMLPGHERFESGTINYLDIPAIEIGLDHIRSIGMDNIQHLVSQLTGLLLQELQSLQHDNGQPLIEIVGPKTVVQRGGTISMLFLDAKGQKIPFQVVEGAANQRTISLRTGCFCNPGVDEVANEISPEEMLAYFASRKQGDYYDAIDFLGKLRGTVRVSVSFVTNARDLDRFVEFARSFLNHAHQPD